MKQTCYSNYTQAFMKKISYSVIQLLLICILIAGSCKQQTGTFTLLPAPDVLPTPSHIEWAEAEIGVIIHFDVVNFRPDYNFRRWGTHPPVSVFNPVNLNTDQWLEAAQSLGAKYAVLVAKHCSGFSLWPTKAHDYHIGSSLWKDGKGDIVGDFFASCKKYGIKPGLYCSVSTNGYLQVDDPGKVVSGDPEEQKRYNAIAIRQLTELWSNYGEVFEIWFDGGIMSPEEGGPDIAPLLEKLQPKAVVFQGPIANKHLLRWIGNENGRTPYPHWSATDAGTTSAGTIKIPDLHGNPDGKIWSPGEADFPMRTGWQGGWFWRATNQRLLTKDQIMDRYYTSVGHNSNMLLGIVIDTTGVVPAEDCEILAAVGNEIKQRFGKSIAETSGKGQTIEIKTGKKPVSVNHIIIQENIALGERIRKYSVEAFVDKKWQQVCEGISVGHKRIQQFPTVQTDKIRLKIEESAGKPDVKNFAVYYIYD